MGFVTSENTPLNINLVAQAPTTGWSFSNLVATHEKCNAGRIFLNGYNIVAGQTYEFTYKITSISNGYVQPFMGSTAGIQRTTAGFYVETLLCIGVNPRFSFYSNADCVIEGLNFEILQLLLLKSNKTISFIAKEQISGQVFTLIILIVALVCS